MGIKEQGIENSRHRYQVVPRVLVFITHGDEVLLLKGAPDKPNWPNLYNGVGGHVEPSETVVEAARREIAEEAGLKSVEDLRLRGIVNIATEDPRLGIVMFVFTALSPTKSVRPSAEGMPHWVRWHTLPSEQLVADLPVLLPRALSMGPEEPPFFARYWYDQQDQLQISFSEQSA